MAGHSIGELVPRVARVPLDVGEANGPSLRWASTSAAVQAARSAWTEGVSSRWAAPMAHWGSLMISSSAPVCNPEKPRSAGRMAANSALLLVGRSANATAPGVCLTSTAAQPSLTSLDWAVRPTNTAAPAAAPECGLNEPSVQAVSLRRGSP
eukprot:14216150-Alexandrium_andersonii.AAC.1